MSEYVKFGKTHTLPKERVTIFGDPAETWERGFGHHAGGSSFGFILIGAGVLFLLNTLDIVPWSVWDEVFRFWPFILIIWGSEMILGVSRIARLAVSLITLVLVCLVILFSIHQVRPELLRGIPPELVELFSVMKGAGL